MNELSVDIAAEIAALNSSQAPAPQADIPQPAATDDFEVPDPSFWDDPSKEFGDVLGLDAGKQDAKAPGQPAGDATKTAAARADEAAKAAAAVITYKSNGKEKTIDLTKPEAVEDLKRKLAIAEGNEKAFETAAQYKQKMQAMEAELKQAREAAQLWDKVEALRYDKAKLIELFTGQKYDDFIGEEVAKHNIKTMGTEEERRLLEQQDRIRALEERLKLGEEMTKKQAAEAEKKKQAAEAAKAEAQQEWLKTNIDREYFRHTDGIQDDSVKELVYQKSILDIKKMYKEYGKVTNKMVEKAFADNAKRLKVFHEQTVDASTTKALDSKRQAASVAAEAASTKNYEADVETSNLANLSPDKLFKALKFLNSKR
jgi:murein DD-endopeptidase MepM/ murein hydrolase activator NlpD